MYEGVLVVHVILAALLIGLVLLQQGKSGGMGTAFGGAAETLLTTPGASNILSRSTGMIAALFFVTSLSLGYLASQKSRAMNQELIPAAIPQPDTVLMTVPTTQEAAPSENAIPKDNAAPIIPQ
ncbi:MAG: preprotein translocase subunit SecG [Legionellales bacterium]|jgi:preprotein translocase subunit SecG